LFFEIDDAKIVLGVGIALAGGHTIPVFCFDEVLGQALAVLIHVAQDVLGFDMALIGREAQPSRRLAIILLHAPAIAVKNAEIILGVGVFIHGKRLKGFEGRFVVAFVEGGLAFGISRPNRRCDPDRENDGEQEAYRGAHHDDKNYSKLARGASHYGTLFKSTGCRE